MITVRPVTEADDTCVRELITGILEREFSPEERAYFGSDIEHVFRNYAGPRETFFVATDQDKVVGTAGIKEEDDRNALLRRIFVRSDYRGRKIGSQLISNAVSFCKTQGYQEIIFKTTSRMSEAIKLCEANGFVKRVRLELGGLELLKFTMHLEKIGKGEKVSEGDAEKKKRRKP
ncbi:MAG TPA: GNAT family N-acetyltransferase [Candidatus Omnitrophota bacterium]|nr:GNAT family N-acetyltransferase [Candidatus Omnitrophota bacterium]